MDSYLKARLKEENEDNNDFSKMLEMVEVIKNPFNDKEEYISYKEAPSDDQKVQRTFCGT